MQNYIFMNVIKEMDIQLKNILPSKYCKKYFGYFMCFYILRAFCAFLHFQDFHKCAKIRNLVMNVLFDKLYKFMVR